MQPVWHSARDAMRLHAWSRSQLGAIRDAVAAVCSRWASDWGLPTQVVDIRPVGELAVGGGSWVACGSADVFCWMCETSGERTEDESAVLGSAPTPITTDLQQRWRRDLRVRLVRAFGAGDPVSDGCPLPARLASSWSGALDITCGGSARLVADVPALRIVAGLAPARAPATAPTVVGIADALVDVSVRVELELAGCELAAPALLSLAPGDVVCLPHALDEPVRVLDADGSHCFLADLRRVGGKRAAQLCGGPGSRPRSQRETNDAAWNR